MNNNEIFFFAMTNLIFVLINIINLTKHFFLLRLGDQQK